jgi:GTP-binding protein Era
MIEGAWAGAKEADTTLLLVDSRAGLTDEVKLIVEGLKEHRIKAVLVLNKIDTIKREKLLDLSAQANALGSFQATFMISALDGSGVSDLLRFVAGKMPEGPWLYPEDQSADVQLRFLASEITREKLYLRLHDELPYASTVETEKWEDRKDGSVRIEQVIYVERDSQKKIVLGKGGQTIKQIGQLAHEEIEKLLERRVHLFLFVKVRENWAEDPERLLAMGLEPQRRAR